MLYFIYKTKSNVSYHIKGAQQLFERRLPTRRLPAAAHQKAAAVVRGGYRQRCCGGSPCAVPARQPATPRSTSDRPPPHPHHPAPLPLSLPITPRQPRVPSPTSPRPQFPGLLAPLRPALTLSAAIIGSPNVSNQQNRRLDLPPRHCWASNSGSVPARRRTAPPRPICPFLLLPPRPGWPGQAGPRNAVPALRLPRGPNPTQ